MKYNSLQPGKSTVSGARQLLGAIQEIDEQHGEAMILISALEFFKICRQHGGLTAEYRKRLAMEVF